MQLGPFVLVFPTAASAEAFGRQIKDALTAGPFAELTKEIRKMSQEVQDLIAETAAIKTVGDSAIALLNKLFALVSANIDNPVALQTVLADLRAEKQAIADAVSANTPAETTTP